MHTRFPVRMLALLLLIGALAACNLSLAYHEPDALGKYPQATTTGGFGPIVAPPTPTALPSNVQPTAVPPTTAPAAAATATATTGPTATPLPTLRSDVMGIQAYANLQQDLWPGILDRAQFMGFKWIKVQLSWKELEPDSKGTYSPQLAVLRENIIGAGRRTFKVLVSIAKAPDWARPANARGQNDGPPANPQDLADFINKIFDDFGPSIAYINAIEIWNEPNTAAEWTGATLDGATYMKYFNAAYKAIRARAAQMPIITAGPAPTADHPGGTDDRTWLEQIYKAGLPKTDPFLSIGVHPYGWANPPEARCCVAQSKGWDNHPSFFFLDTVYAYRDIAAKNGHANVRLWATEFGWATFKGLHYKDHIKGPPAMPPSPDAGLGWMNVLDENQQAAYVIRAFNMAQTGDLANFMGPMFLWNMNFATLPGYVEADKPSRPEAGFSVLDSDWNTRPIYNLLQSAPKQ